MCDDELIVSYLYEDLPDADRGAFERHLRECADCRAELAALRGLRSTLTAWTPPQPDLAFRVVDRAQQPKASWRGWWTPAFGLAAAAVLVLAAAAAVAHVEVQYGASGFSLRTGWNATAAPQVAAAAAPAAVTPVDAGRLETAFAGIERRIHDLETASHAAAPAPVRQAALTNGRASDDEILRRVRDLLAQSESRQQQELALRIGQVIRDVDAQRTADLARIQQGMGRIDAMTTADAAAHRELANYLLTSSRQK